MLTILNEELYTPGEVLAEEQLLDVAVVLLKSVERSEEVGKNIEIINAEGHFMAQHLKKTLERSRNWGNVRVVPEPIEHADLLIEVALVRSVGSEFMANVEVRDATGIIWFKESYWQSATPLSFQNLVIGERDVFQGFYNHIANELAKIRRQKEESELGRIREIAKLRFAAQISPEAFSDYFIRDEQGMIKLLRLPSRDAPEMERVLRIHQRDAMFGEVLNGYYEDFYNTIWPSYESWRYEIVVEEQAKYLARKEGMKKALLGTALVGAAVALGVSGLDTQGLPEAVLAGAGLTQVVAGVSKLKQIKIHETAMAELTESFATESKPIVMDFEGKQYELQGTAKEQFHKWQTLLRQLYKETTVIDALEEESPL